MHVHDLEPVESKRVASGYRTAPPERVIFESKNRHEVRYSHFLVQCENEESREEGRPRCQENRLVRGGLGYPQ